MNTSGRIKGERIFDGILQACASVIPLLELIYKAVSRSGIDHCGDKVKADDFMWKDIWLQYLDRDYTF